MELRTLSGLTSYVIWNGVFFQRNQLHIYRFLAPDASSRCHDKQVVSSWTISLALCSLMVYALTLTSLRI